MKSTSKTVMQSDGRPLIEYKDSPEMRVIDLATDGLPSFSVLGFTRFRSMQREDEEHVHDGCVEIVYCLRGGGLAFSSRGQEVQFKPGQMFVSRPDEPYHLLSIPKGVLLYWCLFRLPRQGECVLGLDATDSRWLSRQLLDMPRRLFDGNDGLRRLFQRLFELHDDTAFKPHVRRLLMRNAAMNLLLGIVDASNSAPSHLSDMRIEQVLQEMRSNPGGTYRLDDIAEATGHSATSLNTLFKRVAGLPPHAFLLHCRIARAKEELVKPGCSIASLAWQLGFRSSRHFSAQFKAVTGKLPSKWQQGTENNNCIK